MDAARWLVREWDDGSVLFDRVSGATHALDPLSSELIKFDAALHREPERLAGLLAEQFETDLQSILPAVRAALEQLTHLDII